MAVFWFDGGFGATGLAWSKLMTLSEARARLAELEERKKGYRLGPSEFSAPSYNLVYIRLEQRLAIAARRGDRETIAALR